MHLLKPGSCIRKGESSTRISDKIQPTLLVQLKAQQVVKKDNGMWGRRKQKTDLGSIETHTPKE